MCSLIIGDRQTSTRLAVYPPSPCEQGLGASHFQQRRHSSAHVTRLIRNLCLVFAGCHWPQQLAALCWIWSTRHACFSWTFQQSACDGSELVGWRCQSFLPSVLKCYEAGGLGGETASPHPWLRVRLDLARTCAALSPVAVGGLGPVRKDLFDPSLVLKTCFQDPMFGASVADRHGLAVILVDQNICELVGSNVIVEEYGRKVQSDPTGARAGNDCHTAPQHLNTNIKLSNREQHVVVGDMQHLPTSGR